MQVAQTDIIARLRKDILIREGLKINAAAALPDIGLGSMNQAFPDKTFPTGCIHECICDDRSGKTATAGFIAGIVSVLMKEGSVSVWIGPANTIFPPALAAFGIDPCKIVFVELHREKDRLWAMEEALACEGLSAVVGEIAQLDFTASRRLQLAVEKSHVTGFVIRQTERLQTTACVARWKIRSAGSSLPEGMPGLGFPRWQVDLLRIRNGRPGSWQFEWNRQHFMEQKPSSSAIYARKKIV
ncbi:ImuA family protein [Sediminibacterium soli]|uniref:ImuA family protein n=1 Tax=Sediminibacterium soli TaxID=2698829 RepID=UPI00137B0729|nr:Error-prone repair protein ImuA [Sediminibacterium soli]NCI47012.1 Error-prone repair protein ImuA [Sediminibacterium soli]